MPDRRWSILLRLHARRHIIVQKTRCLYRRPPTDAAPGLQKPRLVKSGRGLLGIMCSRPWDKVAVSRTGDLPRVLTGHHQSAEVINFAQTRGRRCSIVPSRPLRQTPCPLSLLRIAKSAPRRCVSSRACRPSDAPSEAPSCIGASRANPSNGSTGPTCEPVPVVGQVRILRAVVNFAQTPRPATSYWVGQIGRLHRRPPDTRNARSPTPAGEIRPGSARHQVRETHMPGW